MNKGKFLKKAPSDGVIFIFHAISSRPAPNILLSTFWRNSDRAFIKGKLQWVLRLKAQSNVRDCSPFLICETVETFRLRESTLKLIVTRSK